MKILKILEEINGSENIIKHKVEKQEKLILWFDPKTSVFEVQDLIYDLGEVLDKKIIHQIDGNMMTGLTCTIWLKE